MAVGLATLAIAAAVIVSGDPQREIAEAVRRGDAAAVRQMLIDDPALAMAKVYPQGSNIGGLRSLRTEWAGRYVIHDAIQTGGEGTEILDALARAGADLTVRYEGRTLLHLAAADGRLSAVRWLLERGADISARVQCDGCPEQGRTPLHHAHGLYDQEMTALLLDHGADPGAVDAAGQSPLHVMAALGSPAGALALCASGADPRVRDDQGRTPHDVAVAVDRTGRATVHAEIYGPGEMADWLRQEGGCEKLATMSQTTGRRVSDDEAVVVFRAFACARGVANACT